LTLSVFSQNILCLNYSESRILIFTEKRVKMASSEVEQINQNITDSSKGDEDEDIVNPWDVASSSSKGVNYEKLIREYIILKIVNIIPPFLVLYCR